MTNDDLLVAELRRDEGERLTLYRCTAGKLTIGVGRNIEDRGISADESAYLLKNDIALCRKELTKALPWWTTLDDVRQRVLINMAFNMGVPKLLGFKNTLAAVKAGRWEDAAEGMLDSAWAKQVKGRATRLAAMMRTGKGGEK